MSVLIYTFLPPCGAFGFGPRFFGAAAELSAAGESPAAAGTCCAGATLVAVDLVCRVALPAGAFFVTGTTGILLASGVADSDADSRFRESAELRGLGAGGSWVTECSDKIRSVQISKMKD